LHRGSVWAPKYQYFKAEKQDVHKTGCPQNRTSTKQDVHKRIILEMLERMWEEKVSA
jgi:hypothetical protein